MGSGLPNCASTKAVSNLNVPQSATLNIKAPPTFPSWVTSPLNPVQQPPRLIPRNPQREEDDAFNPSDVKAANKAGSAVEMPNSSNWIQTLLPGANITMKTSTSSTDRKDWTLILIRPDPDTIKELQQAKMPLAKVYNMEFDLTCKKK